MKSKADVSCPHLDILPPRSCLFETCLPGNYTIRSGVDGGRRNGDWPSEQLDTLRSRGGILASREKTPDAAHIAGARRGKRASECNHHADCGPDLSRRFSRHDATPAPADQADGKICGSAKARDLREDRWHISIGWPNVASQAPAVDVIAERGQEAADGNRQTVIGSKPREDDHGMTGPSGCQRQKRRCRCQDAMSNRSRPSSASRVAEGGLTSRSLPVMAGSAVLKPVGSQTVFGDCVGKNRNEPGGEIVTHSIYNL